LREFRLLSTIGLLGYGFPEASMAAAPIPARIISAPANA